MELLVIPQTRVVSFKFWMNEQIQTGMRLENQIFQQTARFSKGQLHRALGLGQQLLNQGELIVITAGEVDYIVWSRLQHTPVEIMH